MYKDNYLFENQLLSIQTENLMIRILKKSDCFVAVCHLIPPPIDDFEEDTKINLPLALYPNTYIQAGLLDSPSILITFTEERIRYLNNPMDNLFWYYEETIAAILDSLQWTEYWMK